MNLGAFMDPEFPIFSTTLCYLEREDAYLMLHRIKSRMTTTTTNGWVWAANLSGLKARKTALCGRCGRRPALP